MKRIDINEALKLSEPQENAPTVNEAPSRIDYRSQAGYIIASDAKRAEINKALNNGEPLEDVLLLALECISIMIGDQNHFYNVNREKIRRNYKTNKEGVF